MNICEFSQFIALDVRALNDWLRRMRRDLTTDVAHERRTQLVVSGGVRGLASGVESVLEGRG